MERNEWIFSARTRPMLNRLRDAGLLSSRKQVLFACASLGQLVELFRQLGINGRNVVLQLVLLIDAGDHSFSCSSWSCQRGSSLAIAYSWL
jgi:hypothetical protein